MKNLRASIVFTFLLCSTLGATTLIPAEASKTSDTLFRLRDSYKAFLLEYGYYPPSNLSEALRSLQGDPLNGFNWGKFVFWTPRPSTTKWIFWTSPGDLDEDGNLIDGWSRPFRYDSTKDGFIIWSTGPEGSDSIEHALKSMRATVLIPRKEAEQGAAANP